MGTDQRMLALVSLVLVAAADPPPKAATTPNPPAPPAKTQVQPAPRTNAPAPAGDDAATGAGTVFKTNKTLADLEKCLTDRLSQGGEVTSVPIEGVKTLMYRTTDEPAMMIDLAPPTVKVTTKFAIGTEPIVKSCL
jgi:hypothetical protein